MYGSYLLSSMFGSVENEERTPHTHRSSLGNSMKKIKQAFWIYTCTCVVHIHLSIPARNGNIDSMFRLRIGQRKILRHICRLTATKNKYRELVNNMIIYFRVPSMLHVEPLSMTMQYLY
jgi:hypothetical protein